MGPFLHGYVKLLPDYVVSLQSGTIDVTNATNEIKGAADAVCYRNQAKW